MAGLQESPGGPPPLQLDALLGQRVRVWWPEHGGWWDGVVTDFSYASGQHWCCAAPHATGFGATGGATSRGAVLRFLHLAPDPRTNPNLVMFCNDTILMRVTANQA